MACAISADFDQQWRATLHTAVLGVLTNIAGNLEASSQIEEAIEAIYPVVRGACANFSEAWNSRHAHALARRLPVEVMTECLRASHVSRRWRAVALADSRLWTNFRIRPFSSAKHQRLSLDRLERMLQRSRPLTVRLQVPHNSYAGRFKYCTRVFAALRSEAHRLEEYSGPASVFQQETSFPALISFNCLDTYTQDHILVMSNTFAAHNVPNLRRLVAPVLDWPRDAVPYVHLQHLVCHLREDARYEHLFVCCPNLVTVELLDVAYVAALPSAPLPRSLQHVTLHAAEDPCDIADFGPLLEPWSGARIPHVSLSRTTSGDVSLLVPIVLSAHNLPVKLVTYDNDSDADIVMTAGEFRWEISSTAFWDTHNCFDEFRVLCAERLAALSVPLSHFWACCDVRTQAPHLVDLEIRLCGHRGDDAREPDMELGSYLRAPRLRRFSLVVSDSFRKSTRSQRASTVTIFDALEDDFRALLVYDADLLDSIDIRCAPRHLDALKGHDFSCFAKTFNIDTQ